MVVAGINLPVVTRAGLASDCNIPVAQARQGLDLSDLLLDGLLLVPEHHPTSHRALGTHGDAVGAHVVKL